MLSTIPAAWEVLPLASRVEKTMGILFIGQVIDKKGNIYVFNEPSVFGTELDSGIICEHIFSSIAWDVIVDAQFQSI